MTETPTAPTASDTAQPDYPLSPGDAAQRLVDLTAAYRAANPTNELSPEEAEQKIGEMAAAYKKANRERLQARDAEIVGDDSPPKPFETTRGSELSLRNTLRAIEDLRLLQIPDKGIAKILAGDWTADDYQWAVAAEQQLLSGSPELRQRVLSGDPEATKFLVGISAVIAAGPKAP
jgi:hypothetical protein